MIRISTVYGCLMVLAAFSGVESAHAQISTDTLLPNSTKAYISIADVEEFSKNWQATQIGQLIDDPLMRPFIDDLKLQRRKSGKADLAELGISFDEVLNVPGGEAGLAIVLLSKQKAGSVFIADVTDHEDDADALVKSAVANLKKQGGTATPGKTVGVTLVTMKPRPGETASRRAAYYLKGTLLVVSDNLELLEDIVRAAGTARKDSLSTLPAYKQTMERCRTAAGDTKPHAHWFVEPFGLADALEIINPPTQKRKGKDMLTILREQGFSAIQGIGGFITLMTDKYEVKHHVSIYAPPVPGAKTRYLLAAQALDFPNGGDFAPQQWVPRELGTYLRFNWSLQQAFNASGTLVDEVASEPGLFEDVLDSLKTAKNGPQVDIRNDLVGNLGKNVTVLRDYQPPAGIDSERLLFAVEATNPTAVAEALRKAMEADEEVMRVEFEGHVLWVVVTEAAAMPRIEIETGEGAAIDHIDRRRDDEEEEEEEMPRLLPHAAMTVANGHLLVASHRDFLEKVLGNTKAGRSLATSVDYKIVLQEMKALGSGQDCAHAFSRTDEAYRATYELIRQGKMPEAETLAARLLKTVLPAEEGQVRRQRIDASKLPDYDVVRRYLGPGGAFVKTEENGWFVTGFLLNKQLK